MGCSSEHIYGCGCYDECKDGYIVSYKVNPCKCETICCRDPCDSAIDYWRADRKHFNSKIRERD